MCVFTRGALCVVSCCYRIGCRASNRQRRRQARKVVALGADTMPAAVTSVISLSELGVFLTRVVKQQQLCSYSCAATCDLAAVVDDVG